MLCDDIIADKYFCGLYDGFDYILDRIKVAQKFILTSEFCAAADGLVENFNELNKVVPMCRTPFPHTWIEFLHDDRPHWDPNGPHGARPVDPERHQGPPSRVGFLLEQIGDNAKKWEAHLFWRLRTVPSNVTDSTNLNGSLMMLNFNCEEGEHFLPTPEGVEKTALYDAVSPNPARFGNELLYTMLLREPQIGKRLLEYAQEDWGGELRFLVACLGLMNARNVVETQRVDRELENKKRAKHGKRPLFSHTILKVRPFIVQHERVEKGGHHDYRLHFVRGHFKHRRTGLFWWSMHARGDASVGRVEKDYEVTGK